MRNLSVVAATFLFWSISANAQSIEKGQSVCYEVQNAVNGLVDFTETKCLPSGGEAGALSFIVISSEPVFSIEASRKAWILVAIASIGKTLNDQPSLKVDELWLSDVNQMKDRVAYVMPVSLAKSLQRKIYNGQIDLDGMYAEIKKNLVRKTVSR